MANMSSLTQVLFVAAFYVTSECSLEKVPQHHGFAGVFMLIEGGRYTLNFTAATAACLVLNVTIATRVQMERALLQGLQTCKFGWIQEKVAVVPRLKSDLNCGKGKTGLVEWNVNEDRKFAVFCFNASDLEETLKTTTTHLQTSTRTQTPPHTTNLIKSTSTSPTSTAAEAPEQPSFPSAFTLLVKTTHSARPPPTSTSLKTFSTLILTSPHLSTSSASVASFTTHASGYDSHFSVTTESVLSPSMNSAKPSLGALYIGIIVLGVIFPLLTAAGAVCYCKRNIFSEQNEDMETEMWEHTDSEMDLHSRLGEEEVDSDRKYSSDIMLCVNPDLRTN
ncbi:lymphatic vessel endothelial hyaluronic acid receptor 1b [Anabas testudineus]|uniref:lymphatic vessel endothelial hyaluronic acid receptor 1b n=1 Tax=Anabas testudineus TaxID=64144 RepID=UPI000E464AC0|nr:lymphatic vessel endothelial hyaluronic acid receptor 1b [Anabas testudineus]